MSHTNPIALDLKLILARVELRAARPGGLDTKEQIIQGLAHELVRSRVALTIIAALSEHLDGEHCATIFTTAMDAINGHGITT